MIDLFWEIRQSERIGNAESLASGAREMAGRAVSVESHVERLSSRLEKLTLICNAMWSLIQDKTDLTEDDLLARAKEIDAEDGTVDGKVTRGMIDCPKCKRPFSRQHARCLYCGYAELPNTAFDAV